MTQSHDDGWSVLRRQFVAEKETEISTMAAVETAIDALVKGIPGTIRDIDGVLALSTDEPLDVLQQATFCALKMLTFVSVLGEIKELGDVRLRDVDAMGETTEILLGFLSEITKYADGGSVVEPLEQISAELVRNSRALGLSWRRIGRAVSMTGAGIFKKARQLGWIDEVELSDPDDS